MRTLVEGQLRPAGLVVHADGSNQRSRSRTRCWRSGSSTPSPTTTDPTADGPFGWLFNPVVVIVVLAALVAVRWWVLFKKGLASATYEAFDKPALLLLVVVVTVLSAGFHEFGHAAAARRGGATPGAMGAGIYLVWPAFYTDVTDSYRLGRWGRVLTDLGGLYFNAIVAVGDRGRLAGHPYDALLLVIATQILQMVRSCAGRAVRRLPRAGRRHRSAGPVPAHQADPAGAAVAVEATRSRRCSSRGCAGCRHRVGRPVVPLLVCSLGLMVLHAPRILGTAWDSLALQWERIDGGTAASVATGGLQLVALALPVAALGLTLARISSRVGRRTWRWSEGSPRRRAGLVSVAATSVAVIGFTWAQGDYRPIQPGERGTIQDGVRDLLDRPSAIPGGAGEAGKAPAAQAPPIATPHPGHPARPSGEARARARDAGPRAPERAKRASTPRRPSPGTAATAGEATPAPASEPGTVEADAEAETPAGNVGANVQADSPPVPVPAPVDEAVPAVPTAPPVPTVPAVP